MGTSASFRSPLTPRWQALNRAYEADFPPDRLRVQLLLAAQPEWLPELCSPSLATFVEALTTSYDELGERLGQAERPSEAVADVVRRARDALAEEGWTAAAPFAERALQVVLISTARGDNPLGEASSAEAAEAWVSRRGDEPSGLVRRFLGELLGQLARHAVARDAQRLVAEGTLANSADARRLTETVAAAVARAADDVEIGEQPAERWPALVEEAFARGIQLRSS